MEAVPSRGVRLRYYRELLPRQICCDLQDIRRRHKRQFRVTAINRSAHAAHECGYFVAGLKFSTWCCDYLTHALNSADLGSLSPFTFAHMGFGVIYAESFYCNQDMASFWLRVRQLFNHQTLKSTETVQNNCTHVAPSVSYALQYRFPAGTLSSRKQFQRRGSLARNVPYRGTESSRRVCLSEMLLLRRE